MGSAGSGSFDDTLGLLSSHACDSDFKFKMQLARIPLHTQERLSSAPGTSIDMYGSVCG